MEKEKLKAMTTVELENKRKGLRLFSGLFIFLILALSFFEGRSYLISDEINWPSVTIIICTVGGFAMVYEELRQVRKELKGRGE